MAKIELAILVGAESKAWLEKAQQLVDRLEELTKGVKEDASEDEDDTESTVKKSKKKVQKKTEDFDEDDDSDSADDEEDSDDAESESSEEDSDDDSDSEPVKKKKKAVKYTSEDVNTACKERMKREIADNGLSPKEARAVVGGILKKKFKVASVSDLEADQYLEVIKVMKK